MNKELKILAIVVFFTLVTYWGVEPFAHSQMHKHVESMNMTYNGAADIESCSADKKEMKEAFWADVTKIAALKGDAAAGEGTYAMCAGCHMEGAVNMGGVIPPSLEKAGSLYDKNYLIALIKDPAIAMNTDHKYADTMTHPMGSIKTMVTEPQDIANVVAFLLEKKAGELTPKEAYIDACGRCHTNKYGNMTQLGETPKFKHEKDALAHKIKVLDEQAAVKGYMGKLPPDLSIIIRARSEHFLKTFIENPQSQLPGTSMPRTGLTEEGYEKVMTYLGETGDNHKADRDSLGWKVILFFVIFSLLAYLWKQSVWSKLH